jgi:hypothetical protein
MVNYQTPYGKPGSTGHFGSYRPDVNDRVQLPDASGAKQWMVVAWVSFADGVPTIGAALPGDPPPPPPK